MGRYVDLVAGVFVVAIVYMLVRPTSPGTQLVTTFGDLVTAITRLATT